MRFLWPDLLWLLLLIPALVAAYVHALLRKKSAVRYASLLLVREALGRGHAWRRHLPPALFLLAITLAILAVARPSAVVVLPSQYLTLIMAMDVSRSMQATDVEPNRITAAQAAAKAFISELPRNVRVGIVAFAATATVVQTPTENREDLTAAIDRFLLQRGTATGSALLMSLATLLPEAGIDVSAAVYDDSYGDYGDYGGAAPIDRSRRAAKSPKKDFRPVPAASYRGGAILLLSDGRRTTGPDPLEAAKMAAGRGVRVFTVGFGTHDGALVGFEGWSFFARPDEATLRAVAKITGGEYMYASTAADLRKVYDSLSVKFTLEARETEVSALFSAAAAMLALAAVVLSLLWFHRSA